MYNYSTFEAVTVDLTKPVGTVPGGGSVSSGSVSYSIPIEVPPGTNGIAPKMTLSYNGGGVSGHFGMGWSISGLSVISRAARNIHLDGYTEPESTTSPVFALDGQRLIEISPNEFRTENENFVKILGEGNINGSSNYQTFKVMNKDGSMVYFGLNADAKRVDDYSSVYIWQVSRIESLDGNYMDFTYETINKEQRIKEIKYTGNIYSGLQPYNKVTFNYIDRSDKSTVYFAGQELKINSLVSSIVITNEANEVANPIVRKYLFTYAKNDLSSFLQEVTIEAADGTTLNPTRFLYDVNSSCSETFFTNYRSAFSFIANGLPYNLKEGESFSNFNLSNKGYSDFIYYTTVSPDGPTPYPYSPNNSYMFLFSRDKNNGTISLNGTNIFRNARVVQGGKYVSKYGTYMGDTNGNGRSEYIIEGDFTSPYRDIEIIENNIPFSFSGKSLSPPSGLKAVSPPEIDIRKIRTSSVSADFDGDGATDILSIFRNNNIYAPKFDFYISRPVESAAPTYRSVARNPIDSDIAHNTMLSYTIPLDVDGDGTQELLVYGFQSTPVIYKFKLLNGSWSIDVLYEFTHSLSSLTFNGNTVVKVGDFNGDGKDDILHYNSDVNYCNIKTYVSDGQKFIWLGLIDTDLPYLNVGRIAPLYNQNNTVVEIADFNGDKKSDILIAFTQPGGLFRSDKKHIEMYFASEPRTLGVFGTTNFTKRSSFIEEGNWLPFGLRVVDMDYDGIPEVLYKGKNDVMYQYSYLSFCTGSNQMLAAKDGIGTKSAWWSVPSYETFVYTPYTPSPGLASQGLPPYPYKAHNGPTKLVKQFTVEHPHLGYVNYKSYEYKNGRIHLRGKGFLGFEEVTEMDCVQGIKTVSTSELNTNYHFYLPKKTQTYKGISPTGRRCQWSSWTLLNETTNTYEVVGRGNNRFWSKLTRTDENNLFEGKTSYTTNAYDDDGNITVTTSSINNGLEQQTTTSSSFLAIGLAPYISYPSLPQRVVTTKTRRGQTAYTERTDYAYTPGAQRKLVSKINLAGTAFAVTSTYGYDVFGNVTVTTVLPSSSQLPRSSYVQYEAKGRFPNVLTDVNGHHKIVAYYPQWGTQVWENQDNIFNNVTMSDAFGRAVTNIVNWLNPNQFSVSTEYKWDMNANEKTVWYKRISHPGKPDTKIWYDALGREVKTQVEDFEANVWVTSQKEYDGRGRLYKTVSPYKPNEQTLEATTEYDDYNRPIRISDNRLGTLTTVDYQYSGGDLTQTTTKVTQSAGNQVKSKRTDASGKLVAATDENGTLNYTYDSRGNNTAVNIELAAGGYTKNLVTNTFDPVSGLLMSSNDANLGISNYTYTEFGEQESFRNARGQTTTTSYDDFGRKTIETGPEIQNIYEYYPNDGTASSFKLKKITSGSLQGTNFQEYKYDDLGRLKESKEIIDGIPFTYTFTYNLYNDLTQTTYPSGFITKRILNSNGYLTEIRDNNDVLIYRKNFQTTSRTGYTLGNGRRTEDEYYFGYPTRSQTYTGWYTRTEPDMAWQWDYTSGNLNSRAELDIYYNTWLKNGELYTYDGLDRLKSCNGGAYSNGTLTPNVTLNLDYGVIGNIANKSDVGRYDYNYGNKWNAVIKVSNVQQLIPSAQQDIDFTSFEQPSSIRENNEELMLTYGADYQRIKGVFKTNGNITKTRYYLDNFERNVVNGQIQDVHYVFADGALRCIAVRENNSTTNQLHYVYTDYLGSILTVTNPSGVVEYSTNYSAWGIERNPSNFNLAPSMARPSWLYRGYTGHEHLAQFKLINMNGRLYDPVLGRMLSPDSEIHDEMGTNGYNRFSYAHNNPLKFTDPDGEFPFAAIAIGAGVALASNIINNAANGRDPFDNSMQAMFFGAVGGLASAGIGGVAAGIASPVVKAAFQIGAHGMSGGYMSLLQGGDFGSGFVSGAISSGFSSAAGALNVGNVAMIGVGGLSGGVGAWATGGNFWDGMRQGLITAGLNHAANHAAEGLTKRDDPPVLLRDKNGKPYGVVIDGFFRRLTSTEKSAIISIDNEYVAAAHELDGSVTLETLAFMGAGASMGFGLTSWANGFVGPGNALSGIVTVVGGGIGGLSGLLVGNYRSYQQGVKLERAYIRELANNSVIPGLQNQNASFYPRYSHVK